jgi:hypothetical protein
MKRVDGHSIVIKYKMHAEFEFHMNLNDALWHFLWDFYDIIVRQLTHVIALVSMHLWLWETLWTFMNTALRIPSCTPVYSLHLIQYTTHESEYLL